jgi:geranylgeranyl reductase family protein
VGRYDAIIVGAGPGGSATAIRLAGAGARVLLGDKARFPRDKPCGGGLTMRAVRELPVSPEPVVEHRVDRLGLRLRYGSRFERHGHGPLILMTQRLRLDHYLLEEAARAGAEVREGVRVSEVESTDTGARALVDGERVEAHALIGADGVNGIVARSLGLGRDYVLAVALEGNVPNAVVGDRYEGIAEIELAIMPGGYGWIFPKADHVNVGVGGWGSEGPTLRSRLAEVCARHEIPSESVDAIRGHRLPLRRPGSPASSGRVLLVGDAAGLVDPLTGDGMYEAFVSARLASEAVLDLLAGRSASFDGYTHELASTLGPMTSASWGAKIALDRYPRTTFLVGRSRLAWRAMEKLLNGEMAAPRDARGASRVPLRAIAALAHRAGDPGRAYQAEASAA